MKRGSIHHAAGSRPLNPGEFTFHGFGDLSRDEIRKIIRLGIREGEPKVSTIDAAIFVPETLPAGTEHARFSGGVLQADGTPIEAARTNRKGGKRFSGSPHSGPIDPEDELEDDVVYLGLLFNHFGRVLLESLARAWYLKRVEPTVKVVFNNANSARGSYSSWLPALLAEFGIPVERVWTPSVPTRLRRAFVPEPLFEQFYSAHAMMVEPFHDLASRVAGDVTTTEQPLYLSRRRLNSRQRPVIGEAFLEEILRENGFRIAYPELMPLQDQVRMFNQHREIFSPVGSAAHGILFAANEPGLHLLANRSDIPANYFLCSALAKAPTTFVNCVESAGEELEDLERAVAGDESRRGASGRAADPLAGPQARPQMVDFDAVHDYLRHGGYLKSSPAPLSRGVRARLREAFDEAWAYARIRKATGKSGELQQDTEAAMLQCAERSWPVSLMLARYFARAGDSGQTDRLARTFVGLLSEESDPERIEYFRGDVLSMAPRVARACSASTSDLLLGAVAACWPESEMSREEAVSD